MQLETNIISVIENEGINLRRSGKAHMGPCPFHADKNPSFAVYQDSNRFICYGCGQKGDALDFVMKLRNLTFKEALTYLGIDGTPKGDTRKSYRRKLIAAFRGWENKYYEELTVLYRAYNSFLAKIRNIEEAEKFDQLYHELPIIEYKLDILLFGDDDEKFELFEEVDL